MDDSPMTARELRAFQRGYREALADMRGLLEAERQRQLAEVRELANSDRPAQIAAWMADMRAELGSA